MATCYRCGRPISPHEFKLRRRVKTGERIARKYPNPSISSRHTIYGVRLVCAPCARALDWQARREDLRQYAELAIALLIAFALFLWHLLGQ
jgi:hypothetical protein